jgi:hypothetical protein
MIDWVIPPQTVVTLYIYRVGRSCPARNPFTTRNSQGLLNSTRTRGPPVRLVKPIGQTGVAVGRSGRPTGQTVEGHRSDRWRQPDRLFAILGANRERLQLPPPSLEEETCMLLNLLLKLSSLSK